MKVNTWIDAGEGAVPTELLGRYRLIGLAGTGQNGALFRAHDAVRGEAIAVRMVPRDLTSDAGIRSHLLREVRIARRLTHPNVMRTRDLVMVPTEWGADVLVTTEYVPGQTLARRIREHGPLPLADVLRIGRSVADALVAAHQASILHCNVNPEHVLLAEDGRILLTDFGLGRVLRVPVAAVQDERTDIYGFGGVLYAALAGRFDDVLREPQLRPDIPSDLVAIVARCLQSDPRDRFVSMEEVHGALQAIRVPVDDRPLDARPRGLGGARVVVLPLTAEAGLLHLADAAADEITQTLAMTDGLRVRRFRTDFAHLGLDSGTFDVRVEGELVSDGPDVVLTLRLVASPSGWRLWLGRFEVARAGLVASTHRAAEGIARALTSSSVPERHPGPTDPEALDLLLRGQHETRTQGTSERATALLELARARAPHDPRVLAAVATARLRRASSAGVPTELLVSAERLARDAVVRGSGLPETHLALVEILRYTGDAVGAARSVRSALGLAPGSAAGLAAAGALWREGGDLEASIAHLEQAFALDPEAPATRIDLARVWALLGRTETLEVPTIDRCRFALWYPERRSVLARDPQDVRVDLFGALRRGRWVPESAWAVLESSAGDHRVRAESAQLMIEGRIYAGFVDLAFARLDRAARECLIDRVWLDRCPLLDDLRGDPRFAAAQHIVAGRARAVRRALGG